MKYQTDCLIDVLKVVEEIQGLQILSVGDIYRNLKNKYSETEINLAVILLIHENYLITKDNNTVTDILAISSKADKLLHNRELL